MSSRETFSIALKRSVAAGAIAAAVGLAAGLFLLALNYSVLSISADSVRGALQEEMEYSTEVFDNGGSTFNDCLLLSMTIDRPVDRLAAAISPNRLYGNSTAVDQDICGGLFDLIANGEADPNRHISVPYHQYWSGMRTVLTLTVPAIGLGGTRVALQALWFMACAATFGIALYGIVRERFSSKIGVHAALILGCLLLFYQTAESSQALTRASTDILFFVAFASYLRFSFDGNLARPSFLLLGMAGALVSYFELLHGAVPIFIAMLVFFELSARPGHATAVESVFRSAPTISAFIGGLIAAFILKITLVTLVIDGSYVPKFFDALQYRITGDERQYFENPLLASRFEDDPSSVYNLVKSFYRYAGTIAYGWQMMGVTWICGTAIVQTGAAIAWFRSDDRELRSIIFACLISSAVIYLWWLLFMQHTINHPHFMLRLWAWPFGMTCVLLYSLIRHWQSRKLDGQAGQGFATQVD